MTLASTGTPASRSPITVSLFPSATAPGNSPLTPTTESGPSTDPAQETDMPPRDEHWTIDKKIPIAFLIGLFLQGAGIVWYFAKLDARQTNLEERIDITDADQDRLANILTAVIDRTTRLEVDYLSSKTDVARRLGNIEAKLDRMLEALPQRRSSIPMPDTPVAPAQRKAQDTGSIE